MIKIICKIFGIERMYEHHQYRNNEGKYINTKGHIYLIKGIWFNSAKFKAVYACDKKCAFKYVLDTVKGIAHNIVSIKKTNSKNVVLS